MSEKWTLRFLAIHLSRFCASVGLVAQSFWFLVEIFAMSTGGLGGFFFSVRLSGTTGRGSGGSPSAEECCAGGAGGGAATQVNEVSSLETSLSSPKSPIKTSAAWEVIPRTKSKLAIHLLFMVKTSLLIINLW